MRLFVTLFLCFLANPAYAQLKILSDIRPIYYLVEGVNQGINTHKLLFNMATSPHDYQPKPSDIRKINNSDIIFKVGQNFIPQLDKFNKSHKQIPFADPKNPTDLHIWLSPLNAITITQKIALTLSKSDPKNREKYQYNAEQQTTQLRILDLRLQQQLSPFKNKYFFTQHAAYGYFTENFGLNPAIAFTKTEAQKISAKRMHQLIQTAKEKNINCIMLEPQFSDKISKNISRNNKNIQTSQWDLLGTELELSANSYPLMLKNMANALTTCLKGKS